MRTLRSHKLRRQAGHQGYAYQVQKLHQTLALGVKAGNKGALFSRQLLTTKIKSLKLDFFILRLPSSISPASLPLLPGDKRTEMPGTPGLKILCK